MYGRVTRPLLDFSERGLGTRLPGNEAKAILTRGGKQVFDIIYTTVIKTWYVLVHIFW